MHLCRLLPGSHALSVWRKSNFSLFPVAWSALWIDKRSACRYSADMDNRLLRVWSVALLVWSLLGGAIAQTALGNDSVAEAVEELGTFNAEVNKEAHYFIYLESAGWCSYCRELMPKVVAEYEEMKEAGVEVILIGADKSKEEALEYLEEYDAPFPGVYGEDVGNLPGFEHSAGVPWMRIVDARGNVLESGVGSKVMEEWRSVIAEAEEGSNNTNEGATRNESGGDDDTGSEPEPAFSVAEVLEKLETFNAEPNLEADYYVYLESASWCGPCCREMPKIVKAYAAMKKAGIEILLIGADRTPEDAQKYLEKFGAKFPGVHRKDEGVNELPGYTPAQGIPTATFVSADGEVLQRDHGSIIMNWKKIISNK